MRRRRCCSTCASELAAARATRAQSWRDDLESAKCVWEGQRKRLHQGRWLRCVVRTSGWVEARMSASCTHAAAGRTMECEHVSGLRTRPQVWFIRACSRVQASASASRVKLSYPTVVATPCDACGNACGPDNGHSEDTVNLCRISANTRGQNRIRTLAIHVRKGLVLPRPLKRRLCCNQGGGTGNDNFLEEEHLQEIGSKHAIWVCTKRKSGRTRFLGSHQKGKTTSKIT